MANKIKMARSYWSFIIGLVLAVAHSISLVKLKSIYIIFSKTRSKTIRLTWCSLVYKVLNPLCGKTWSSSQPAVCCSMNTSDILHAKTGPKLAAKTSLRFFYYSEHRSSLPLASPHPPFCHPCLCPLQLRNRSLKRYFVLDDTREYTRVWATLYHYERFRIIPALLKQVKLFQQITIHLRDYVMWSN